MNEIILVLLVLVLLAVVFAVVYVSFQFKKLRKALSCNSVQTNNSQHSLDGLDNTLNNLNSGINQLETQLNGINANVLKGCGNIDTNIGKLIDNFNYTNALYRSINREVIYIRTYMTKRKNAVYTPLSVIKSNYDNVNKFNDSLKKGSKTDTSKE